MSSTSHDTPIYYRPADLLQRLIRYNTTNPPGNETECITYINTLLNDAGFQTRIIADASGRPNLIARLTGRGSAPPLLLQGHIDVVTTEKQAWSRPPFEGAEQDGYIWGRGTLDMKGGVAMMLAACMRAKAEGRTLPGDVVLAILSDEEAGGEHGADFLVQQHADLFKDIKYALGEFGGFTFHIAGHRFYPIQVLEKQVCWLRAILRGPGGHGSLPMHGGAVAKLGQLIRQLDQQRLPVHLNAVSRQMLDTLSNVLPAPEGPAFRQMLDPTQTNTVLDTPGPYRALFDAVLHNSVNITVLQGGDKTNVIPAEMVADIDGRILPGFSIDEMLQELRQVIGNEVALEIIRYAPGGLAEPNMGLYNTLADILREADPGSTPMPFLMPVSTDGRHFARLGIQTYGFIPVPLPADFNFLQTIHAADERIPVAAMEFGTDAIYKALQRNTA